MIFPSSLKRNDVIGIVAPAGRMNQDIINQAVHRIKTMGFKVKMASGIGRNHYNFSATDEERLHDLQAMLDDKEIKAIICTRGGYGVIRILNKLCFDEFIKNPKWLVGFSDITALHSAINKLGVASIHGPMLKSFLNFTKTGVDVEILFSFLQGESPEYIINSFPNNKFGCAKGVLTGGNLSILHALRGTEFDFDPTGKILFIEDLNEYLYHLDRVMHNLKLGGVLEKISGLVVGQFSDMKDNETPFGESIEEIVLNNVAEYNYPVAFNFPSGHVETNFPLVLGDDVELKVEENQVSLVSV